MPEAIEYSMYNTDKKEFVMKGTLKQLEYKTGFTKIYLQSITRNSCTNISGKVLYCERLGYNITFRKR